jgi:hypothetical protein
LFGGLELALVFPNPIFAFLGKTKKRSQFVAYFNKKSAKVKLRADLRTRIPRGHCAKAHNKIEIGRGCHTNPCPAGCQRADLPQRDCESPESAETVLNPLTFERAGYQTRLFGCFCLEMPASGFDNPPPRCPA